MRIPLDPPASTFSNPQELYEAVNQLQQPGVQQAISHINEKYYHWDRVRRLPIPAGLTPELLWRLVKLSRSGRLKSTPLSDSDGRPFRYAIPEYVYRVLHDVDRMAGGVHLAREETDISSLQDQIIVSSLMEEAISTSKIEGAVTTIAGAKELLRSGRGPRDKSEKMVVNSYRTIQLLKEKIEEPLSLELLFEIQSEMTKGTLTDPSAAGRLRYRDEPIVVADNDADEVVFVPPNADLLPTRLQRLFDFANDSAESKDFVHPLIKASILHFWLAYEHPFVDGNGRTARALFYWSMLRARYWLFEFLSVSTVIVNSKSQYYRSFLHSEHDENDLTYSVLYMIEATSKALADLHEKIQGKVAEQRVMSEILKSYQDLNHRQRSLLHRAMKHPTTTFTFESHKNSNGISYQTARTDILNLVERGFLVGTKAGKLQIFHSTRKLEKLAKGHPANR